MPVGAGAERLKGWPHDDKLPPLEPGCKWHFFLSHFQLNGGDQCMALKQSLLEVHPEIKVQPRLVPSPLSVPFREFCGPRHPCWVLHGESPRMSDPPSPFLQVWYDQDNTPTEAGMKEGVSGSETFLVFLTQGVLTRYFVQLEVRTALSLGKPVVLVHETDPRYLAAAVLRFPPPPPSSFLPPPSLSRFSPRLPPRCSSVAVPSARPTLLAPPVPPPGTDMPQSAT